MRLPASKLQYAADVCRELSSLARLGLPWEKSVTKACHEIEQRLENAGPRNDQPSSGSQDLRQLGRTVRVLCSRTCLAQIFSVSPKRAENSLALCSTGLSG